MINYSSYNDVWGNKPNISENLNNSKKEFKNINIKNENLENKNEESKNDDIDCCKIINQILKCDECLEKLANKLNLKKKEDNIDFFTVVEKFELNKFICNNRNIILIILILLFIFSCFYISREFSVKSSTAVKVTDDILRTVDNSKFIKNLNDFVIIPKNLIYP